MDTAALVACDVVLGECSFRGAARRLGRPVATMVSAMRRAEADLSLALVRGEGNSLSPTLEARRISGRLASLRAGVEAIFQAQCENEDARLARAASAALPLRALERFCETLDAGSIRAAAARLNMGQPQLTRELRRLEQRFGAPLLDRTYRGSRPTPTGARFAALAGALVAEWRAMVANAARDFRRRDRTIRFGSIAPLGHESRTAQMLANLIARWPRAADDRPLFLTSSTAEELVANLKSRRLDFALVDSDAETMGLVGVPISSSRLCLVGRPGFSRGRPALEILLSERVAAPSARSGLRAAIAVLLEGVWGFGGVLSPAGGPFRFEQSPANFSEVDSLPVIVNLVRDYGFVSVLPQASVEGIGTGIELIALDAALPLWLVWLPGRDLASTAARISAILAS